MKIFKIKFDSKMPTTRKVTVGKDDDFGLAIQIDGMQTQGPAKLLYAGQEVEANKDLIEGYNVFLLKAVKDSTIAIKDIDSQVTFQVDISIKNTDVVELGGAGSGGGESVWQANDADYYIDNALSVNNCQKVTITGANDQVILKGLCDDASYEIKLGNLILNTPNGIQINGTCSNDAPYIGNVNDCGRKTSYIDFSCGCLNLATNSGGCSNNAININSCGICIDAQLGNLYLNSSNNTLSIHGNNVAVCASTVKINSYTEFDVMVNNNKINIDTNCGRNCILIYSHEGSLNTNVKCTTLSSTSTTNIYACTFNTCARYVSTKAVSYCVNVQGYNIFDATDTYVNFGNCEKYLNQFARYYNLYSSAIGPIIDATDTNNNNITFGNAQRYSYINGSYITLSAANNCGSGTIVFAPVENGGEGTQIKLQSMSTCSGGIASFVLPQCLQFNGACVNVGARSKVLLTLLSALETTYHNECTNDDGNYFNSPVDTVIYNKLTAVFATK